MSCSLVVHRYTGRIVIPLGDLQCGFTPKCKPSAQGCARLTQSDYHKQKFYLRYWLFAYLCMQHWDTFSFLYAYNPFLPSDKVFFCILTYYKTNSPWRKTWSHQSQQQKSLCHCWNNLIHFPEHGLWFGLSYSFLLSARTSPFFILTA